MFIKVLRQKRHLSQEQLAQNCGLSLRTIQRLESGHRVSYSSLRAIATAFELNVDELEQELYTMDKIINEYKDFPLWMRLYIGSGWFSASRTEFQKIEVFFVIVATLFAGALLGNYFWQLIPKLPNHILTLGLIGGLLGAYNVSTTIRIGDKYDVWSRLATTIPKGIFGFFKNS